MIKMIFLFVFLPLFGCGEKNHNTNVDQEYKPALALSPENTTLTCKIKFQQFWAIDITTDTPSFLLSQEHVIYNGEFASTLQDGLDLDLYADNMRQMEAESRENTLASSPNISNFKVNVSVTDEEGECEYRDNNFYLSLETHVVVRDLPRNLTSTTKTCVNFAEAEKKLDFKISLNFGPQRRTTGVLESGLDDFDTLSVLNSEAPPIIFNFSCKISKVNPDLSAATPTDRDTATASE